MISVLRDARGKTLDLRQPPRRVVSLVPSLTETLFALGAGDAVAGVTDFCIFPPDIRAPRMGGTKNPRVDAIRALTPDLVHMNLEENLKKHADAIEEFAPVFVTEPKSVADVASLFETLGEIHGCSPDTLLHSLNEQIATMPRAPFTFACAIWKNPWMWCGSDTYVSDLISAAGGQNVISATRYPNVVLEDVEADIVFLPDEPYLFSEEDAAFVRSTGRRVVGPFPGHLFTWHGSRTILGLRFLRGL